MWQNPLTGSNFKGGSRTAATFKMERSVIIVNGWKPLSIITKRSILDVAAVLDPPLNLLAINFSSQISSLVKIFCKKGLKPATLFKKRIWRRCFPASFVKFLRTSFYIKQLCWLLLKVVL